METFMIAMTMMLVMMMIMMMITVLRHLSLPRFLSPPLTAYPTSLSSYPLLPILPPSLSMPRFPSLRP